MSSKNCINKVGRLSVGQRIKVTKERLLAGKPVLQLSSWVDDITDGILSKIRRIDGGVMLTVSGHDQCQIDFYVGITPIGPLLNHNGIRVEIIEQSPEQGALNLKGGAA